MGVHRTVEEGAARLTLDHPPLNILTRALLGEIRQNLEALAGDPAIRVVLLEAEGRHFSAGADVGEHLPPEYEELIPEFMATISALRDFPLPVVAAVRGKCLGGGFELVQGADIIIAGESSVFGQPEIILGVIAPVASALLPLICPPSTAARIVFTGDPLSAEEARRAGLVAEVVPDDAVDEAAAALCSRIARHSGAALRINKAALRAGESAARTTAFRTAERLYTEDLMSTADAVEGLNSFLEKRSPTWTHR
jgi:cyclohexa-1,5-dienecarbonyl-CoA hydratase